MTPAGPAGAGSPPAHDRPGRSRDAAVLALFAALALATVFPAVLGGKVLGSDSLIYFQPPLEQVRPATLARPSNDLYRDVVYVFHPDLRQVRADVRDGRAPTWTPSVGGGRPLLASQQNSAFYPLTALAYVLPFWWSLGLIAALKLWLAATGTYAFCRALGLRRAPAALAGLAFGFGTFFVAWIEHPHSDVYLLLPWLLLFARRVCRRGTTADAVALAAAVGLVALGGHPESAVIVVLPVLAFAAVELLGLRGTDPRALARRGALIALALGAGCAVGAVMIVPFLELLHQSRDITRGTPPLQRNSLEAFVFPDFWGHPDDPFLGGPNSWAERTAYAGALPTMLAGVALLKRTRTSVFFAVVGLVALAVSIDLPGVGGRFARLPLVALVKLPGFLIVFSFAVAVLAAYGLQHALEEDALRRTSARVAMAVVALVPLGWLAFHLRVLGVWRGALDELLGTWPGNGDAVALASVLRWGLLAVLGGGVAVVLAARRPRAVAVFVVVVTALDLVLVDRGVHSTLDRALATPPIPRSLQALRRTAGSGRVAAAGESFVPNLAARYGVRDVRSHELPVLFRTSHLFELLGGVGFSDTRVDATRPGTTRLLSLFGVRALLVPSGAPPPAGGRWAVAYRDPASAVLRNESALPRAWVAYGWRRAPGRTAALRQAAASPLTLLRDAPIVEAADARPSVPGWSPARVASDRDTSVTVDLTARAPGRLVLDDTYYPGWHARVDGRPAPIAATDGAFRSVPVSSGRHTVVFTYAPRSVAAGALISVLAAAGLAGAAAALRWRRCRAGAGSRSA